MTLNPGQRLQLRIMALERDVQTLQAVCVVLLTEMGRATRTVPASQLKSLQHLLDLIGGSDERT